MPRGKLVVITKTSATVLYADPSFMANGCSYVNIRHLQVLKSQKFSLQNQRDQDC